MSTELVPITSASDLPDVRARLDLIRAWIEEATEPEPEAGAA